jgi:hypothetical protein
MQFYQDEVRHGPQEAQRLRLLTWQPVVDTDMNLNSETPYRATLYQAVLKVSASGDGDACSWRSQSQARAG